MSEPINIVRVGDQFGLLHVLEIDLRMDPTPAQLAADKSGDRAVRVRCQCGDERLVKVGNLFSTKWPTRACRNCRDVSRLGTHRLTGTPLATQWYALKGKARRRGLPLHQPWRDDIHEWGKFIDSLGPKPERGYIDLITPTSGYVPGNIRYRQYRRTH
jgi:hypothetical protein